MELTGRIHSFESCGTVDGPGIRFVVFMQGCPLRCLYCHNADTWNTKSGNSYTPEELVKEIVKYKSYMHFSGGGVTFTGGEPLLQPEFLAKTMKLCKESSINTVIDTSGYLFNEASKEVLNYTDLVLLDIKNFDPDCYKKITGVSLSPTLQFLDYLNNKNIKTWIRYVLVPGLTDNLESIKLLANHLSSYQNIEKIELLGFHKMGEYKWKELNEHYSLTDTKEPSIALLDTVTKILETSGKTVSCNL